MAVLDIDAIDSESTLKESVNTIEAERQCRIHLDKSWPRTVRLEWHAGRGSRPTVILLQPGHDVVQPLSKTAAWFGPFALPIEYGMATDETRKENLRQAYAIEKKRVLDRYDYERPRRMSQEGVEPIGPHRLPNVTVTIIESDGTEMTPISLHEMYKVGEFDALKDTFRQMESPLELKEKYDRELRSMSEHYERTQAAMRAQLAEMAGMVKGVLSAQPAEKAK